MRDFCKISSAFWTGDTGRKLRNLGRDEQLLALFLLTSQNANMIGLYHMPLAMIAHYLGWTLEGASKGLRRVSEAHFAFYDEAAEEVWIPEMAAHQLGEQLDAKDNRVKAVVKEWSNYRKSKFYAAFHERYRETFHLPDLATMKPLASPFEAPSKPLRSKETETETETERERETPPYPRKRGQRQVETIAPGFLEFWTAYPKKKAKQAAIKAWSKIAPNEALRVVIMTALEQQKQSPDWLKNGGQYVPNPATWLNGNRWEDEVTRPPDPANDLVTWALEKEAGQ